VVAITDTYLSSPRRSRVIAAKLIEGIVGQLAGWSLFAAAAVFTTLGRDVT
jgi:hypothetical protein